MTKITRTPILDLPKSSSWATIPGNHSLRLVVHLDYTMPKGNAMIIFILLNYVANNDRCKDIKERKRSLKEDYKRLYISYSIGGQTEGRVRCIFAQMLIHLSDGCFQ